MGNGQISVLDRGLEVKMRPKVKRIKRCPINFTETVVFVSEKRSVTVYDPDVDKIRRLIHKAYEAGWDDGRNLFG